MNEWLERLPEAKGWLLQAGYALLLFVVGWILSKWTYRLILRLLRRQKVDEVLSRFLASIARYAVLATAVITSLAKFGVQTTSLVAIFASAGLAIGLALQGSLGNFASGVMLLFFRYFDLGDWVEVGDKSGKVKDIGLFATTLMTPDSETIFVPNREVTANPITNYSKTGHRRANIGVGVAYGTDLYRASELIVEALEKANLVLDDPAPKVIFSGFGASSLDLVARPWALPDNYPAMQHHARMAIHDALNAAGIEIPFDQIVIHKAED